MRAIKFGMHIFNGDFERARRSTLLAEELGFHSISMDDHLLPAKTPDQRIPQFECYTMLAWMASITKRVRLVPTVGCMSFRNPALLAKMFTTLDYISGGRITAGVGARLAAQRVRGLWIRLPDNRRAHRATGRRRQDNEVDVDAGRANLFRALLPYRSGGQSAGADSKAPSADNDRWHRPEDAADNRRTCRHDQFLHSHADQRGTQAASGHHARNGGQGRTRTRRHRSQFDDQGLSRVQQKRERRACRPGGAGNNHRELRSPTARRRSGAQRARASDRHDRGNQTRDSRANRRTRLYLLQTDTAVRRVRAGVRRTRLCRSL